MLYELLDVLSCRLEIFSRVELLRMFIEELTDRTGHGQTQVRVDIDLADSSFAASLS